MRAWRGGGLECAHVRNSASRKDFSACPLRGPWSHHLGRVVQKGVFAYVVGNFRFLPESALHAREALGGGHEGAPVASVYFASLGYHLALAAGP